MQSTIMSQIDVHSIKRIERRFRQVAEHQGTSSQQLKLSLMERYVNQWLYNNDMLDIAVCDVDNDFRRRLFKPVPIFVKVRGLTSQIERKSLTFHLPYYGVPYEHCRIISDEPFRVTVTSQQKSSEALLIKDDYLPTSLSWRGYIQVFDPKFFYFPQRSEMLEGVKNDISVSIRMAINENLFHLILG